MPGLTWSLTSVLTEHSEKKSLFFYVAPMIRNDLYRNSPWVEVMLTT